MTFRIPVVEITDQRNPPGIGCPYRKTNALFAFERNNMAAHFFVKTKVLAALEEGDVEVGKKRKGFNHDQKYLNIRRKVRQRNQVREIIEILIYLYSRYLHLKP
jgi:hypothetical protein